MKRRNFAKGSLYTAAASLVVSLVCAEGSRAEARWSTSATCGPMQADSKKCTPYMVAGISKCEVTCNDIVTGVQRTCAFGLIPSDDGSGNWVC